jgi:hypothetical protein
LGSLRDQDEEESEAPVKEKLRSARCAHKNIEKISVFYTNADQLPNKMMELRSRISSMEPKPHIIALTEAKPKNARFNMHLADYKIEGYQAFTTDLTTTEGRGIIMYAQDWMDVKTILIVPEYQESLWLEVKLGRGGGRLLCGTVYRSPSLRNEQSHMLLNEMMKYAADHTGKMKLLIMGDFNFPHIDWENWRSRNNCQVENMFLKTCMDALLAQHVLEATRGRLGQNPNTLDLLFTLREDDIGKIEYQSPLGKSDHACLFFDYLCPLGKEHKTRTVYLYNRGSYVSMNESLRRAAWDIHTESQTQEHLDRDYERFCNVLLTSCDKFVPKKTFAAGDRRKRPGITSKVAKAIRKKHRSWTRFMETRTQLKYKEYTRARNKAKTLFKKATMDHERRIAENAKNNPKEFWGYANLKTKAKEKVPELYIDEQRNQTTTSDTEKAEILNNFFASVFTIEPDGEVPEPDERNFDEALTTIDFKEEEITRKLKKLDHSKSKGPDGIHPRILKEAHETLAPPLKQLFQKSLQSGKIPAAWRKAIM